MSNINSRSSRLHHMNNVSEQITASKLEHFPITFFAMSMGITGLTLMWEKASTVFGAPAIIGQLLLTLTTCLFLILVFS